VVVDVRRPEHSHRSCSALRSDTFRVTFVSMPMEFCQRKRSIMVHGYPGNTPLGYQRVFENRVLKHCPRRLSWAAGNVLALEYVLVKQLDGLGTVLDTQELVCVTEVLLDGELGEVKALGYLGVRHPLRDERQDLPLARGERL
jgi:hypothetical protein